MRLTLPRKVADTGPTLVVTIALNSVSDTFSSAWQPAMLALSTCGSFRLPTPAAAGRAPGIHP
jgi:hypothetical protein